MTNAWDSEFLHNLLHMKKTAVAAGARKGKTAREISAAIQLACDCLLSGPPEECSFPEPQSSMDIAEADRLLNELIADKALVILGMTEGEYAIIRPEEDVAQSFPAGASWTGAGRNTVISLLTQTVSRMTGLSTAVSLKAAEFSSIVRPGTLAMMGMPSKEAAPPSGLGHDSGHLGHTLHACAALLRRDINHLKLVQSEMRDAAETAWSQDSLAYAFGVMKAASLHGVKIVQILGAFAEIPWVLFNRPAASFPSVVQDSACGKVVDEMLKMAEKNAQTILDHDLSFNLAAGMLATESDANVSLLFLNLFDAVRKLGEMADFILTNGIRGLAVNHCAYEQALLERSGTLLFFHAEPESARGLTA